MSTASNTVSCSIV